MLGPGLFRLKIGLDELLTSHQSIFDLGDNLAIRLQITSHVLREPSLGQFEVLSFDASLLADPHLFLVA